jgi:hypothetical protein
MVTKANSQSMSNNNSEQTAHSVRFMAIPSVLSCGPLRKSLEANKVFLRSYFEEIWNKVNLALLDKLLVPE